MISVVFLTVVLIAEVIIVSVICSNGSNTNGFTDNRSSGYSNYDYIGVGSNSCDKRAIIINNYQ